MKVKIYCFDVESSDDGDRGYIGEFELPALPQLHTHFTFDLPDVEAKRVDREEECVISYCVLDVNCVIQLDGTCSGWIGVGLGLNRQLTKEEHVEAEADVHAIRRIHAARRTV